jgi:hypothetical protein
MGQFGLHLGKVLDIHTVRSLLGGLIGFFKAMVLGSANCF